MANFSQATEIRREAEGLYAAAISGDWCAWSPAGGYLMALALRAAGEHTSWPAPLSCSCHFLAAPKLGEVALRVVSLRKTRIAESVRVSLEQGTKPILEMIGWCGDSVDGYRHDGAEMPDVPVWDSLPEYEMPKGKSGFQSIWANYEHRPCGPLHWEHDDPREPRQRDWIRLRDFRPGADAFLDAGRAALFLDSFTWPAAAHPHAGDARFIAPTLSFSIDFHQPSKQDWLFSDAHSTIAREGRMAVANRLWDADRKLIASGHGTLICRPRP